MSEGFVDDPEDIAENEAPVPGKWPAYEINLPSGATLDGRGMPLPPFGADLPEDQTAQLYVWLAEAHKQPSSTGTFAQHVIRHLHWLSKRQDAVEAATRLPS